MYIIQYTFRCDAQYNVYHVQKYIIIWLMDKIRTNADNQIFDFLGSLLNNTGRALTVSIVYPAILIARSVTRYNIPWL